MTRLLLSSLAAIALASSLFAQDPTNLADQYRDTANKLIDAALIDHDGLDQLSYLCDRIGNRLSGSQGLEKAIAWAAAQMKADGLVNVATPLVKVPHWVRGAESAALLEPVAHPLTMLGLGGSVATPKKGITAEVLPVSSFEELEKKGHDAVQGKIVLFNVPYEGYGRTVAYRVSGASRAAHLGAVAVLVRSVTPVSLQSPHTGQMEYNPGSPRIPAAAVTIEDATLIQRLADAGNIVKVHLEMEAHTLPDADSANVIGKLGLHPRRTLRVVFWTNEENGGAGGLAYREWIGDRVANHVAAIEMDGGAEKPTGFGITGRGDAQTILGKVRDIGKLLERIDAGSIQSGGGGADIAPLMKDGVPGLAVRTVGTHYFDWHHSPADTADKVKPEDLRANIAAMAVMAFILADMPDTLRTPPAS